MAIIDELIAILGYDVQGEDKLRRFNAGMDAAEKHARSAAQGIGVFGVAVGSFLGGMALEATSRLAGAIKDIPAGVTKTGATFENLGIRLETLEGSSEKARVAMDWIQQFAKDTPLGLADTADAYANLKNYGIDPTNGSLMALTDAMAASGKGTQQLGRLSLALGQAWVKQKLQGGEILQLTEAGIPVWDMLAEATGKNVVELQKLSAAGKLGRDEIQLLIDAIGRKYAGASEKMARTYDGLVDKLGDAYQVFQRMIADAGWFDFVKKNLDEMERRIGAFLETDQAKQWASTISNIMVRATQAMMRFGRAIWRVGEFAVDGFRRLGRFIGDVTRQLSGGKIDLSDWEAFGAALAVLLAWLSPVTAAIVLAGLALDDFLTWLEGGDSIIGDFIGSMPDLIAAFDELAPGVREAVSNAVAALRNGDWSGALDAIQDADWAAVGKKAADAFLSAWEGLSGRLQPYIDQAKAYLESVDWSDAINAGMSNAIVTLQNVDWGNVGEEGGKLGTQIALALIESLGKDLHGASVVIGNALKGELSEVKLWEGGLGSLVALSLKAQGNLITGAIAGITEEIRAAVLKWFDIDLRGAGVRLAQSLWEGFKSYLPSLPSWDEFLWGEAAKPDFDPREHFRIENQINRDRPRVLQMPTQERPVLEDRATRERVGGTSFDRLLQSFNDNLARMVPDNAVQATVTDARQDNRQFPMNVSTNITQNIQQATQAPAAAAQATGQAVNSAVAGQAARIEQEPAF